MGEAHTAGKRPQAIRQHIAPSPNLEGVQLALSGQLKCHSSANAVLGAFLYQRPEGRLCSRTHLSPQYRANVHGFWFNKLLTKGAGVGRKSRSN